MPSTLISDRRLVLARPELAAASLEGVARAAAYGDPEPLICVKPSAALRARPDAGVEQMTQLLFGEAFDVLDESDGWAFGQARRDRYVGYVEAASLGAPVGLPTHWASHLRTYAFVEPDVKAPMAGLISMNSLCLVEGREGRFSKVAGLGFVHYGHLKPIGEYRDDPAAVALEYLGAPYHWGGRESLGVDCSGLVQNALHACGMSCPRDSDLQAAELGDAIDPGELARGDLVGWTGHIGIMIDTTRIVHANGHHMATTVERLDEVVERIAASGSGRPTAYRRLRRP
jgi:hypothetical protein